MTRADNANTPAHIINRLACVGVFTFLIVSMSIARILRGRRSRRAFSYQFYAKITNVRRGVRVVEGAALEKRCGVKTTESSNLFLSAKQSDVTYCSVFLLRGIFLLCLHIFTNKRK